MVAAVDRFEVYHTSTELEALVLENSFIKQYMPHYNIKLKDSEGYPYIKLTQGEYPHPVRDLPPRRRPREVLRAVLVVHDGAQHRRLGAQGAGTAELP